MFAKKLCLDIYCSKFPCQLTILSCDGDLKNVTIQSNISKFCFCTKSCAIRLLASHNGQTIHQTIYLTNLLCQKNFVNFVFDRTILQISNNIITLTDANYGFPIANALLNFK